jgi:hypothetical protein
LQLKSPGVQQEILKAACCDPEVFEILASKTDLVSLQLLPLLLLLLMSAVFNMAAAVYASWYSGIRRRC